MGVSGGCCTVQPVALNEWHFCEMCTNTEEKKVLDRRERKKKKKNRKRSKKPCSQSIAEAAGLRNRDVQAVKR